MELTELQEDELRNKANLILMDISDDSGIAMSNIATGVCDIQVQGKTYQRDCQAGSRPRQNVSLQTMIFTYTKCEEPGCLEAGDFYYYPIKIGEPNTNCIAAVFCYEHAPKNGFCSYCKKWKGTSAWFHSSGLCEDCLDNFDCEDDSPENEYPEGF